MKNKSLIWNLLILLFVFISFKQTAHAKEYDTNATVYRFQQTMAKRGNAQAQFKLGLMHETGSGVEQNLTDAINWYSKAADQNYKPAINRLVYHEIKRSGFKKSNHSQWLNDLQAAARVNEGEALLLLGQMYSEGTGIEKNLEESLKLLRKAYRGDIPGADIAIDKVEKELAKNKRKQRYPRQLKNTSNDSLPAQALTSDADKTQSANQKKTFITAEQLRKQQAIGRQMRLEHERKINAKTQMLGQAQTRLNPHSNSEASQQTITLATTEAETSQKADTINNTCENKDALPETCQ